MFTNDPRRDRRRKLVLLVLLSAVVLAAALLAGLVGTSPSSTAASTPGATIEAVVSPVATLPDETVELEPVVTLPDASEPDGGVSIGDDPEPLPEPDGPGTEPEPEAPADPCDGVVESGANLAVTPDPRDLPPGAMTSSLTIINCGGSDVDWSAHTVPSVSLDTDAGTLAAGAEHELGFT